jgi:hypothetical protein
MDAYPIKISIEQGVQLFPIYKTKRTLTWSDIVAPGSEITFRKCVRAGIEITKLYNMQRDLQEWIRHGKVCLDDCKELAPWAPNPFFHFNCNIGDLVLKRNVLTHEVLLRGGVRFDILWDRYGLTPELMSLLAFTPEQWIQLGLQPQHLDGFTEEQWTAVFGNLRHSDMLQGIRALGECAALG